MPEIERILQSTPGTLQQQWYEDGVAADPGTVTVRVTADDGTVVVTGGTATVGSGTNARSFSLTTAHTARLDTLTVTWTSTAKGTLTSILEVVGGFLFSLSQARAFTGLGGARADRNNDDTYKVSTARILEARTEVERMLEHELGFAMVPRYGTGLFSGDGGTLLMLPPYVRAIRTATVDDVSLTVGDLSFNPYGTLYYSSGWTSGFANVTVGFEHGLEVPPPGSTDVALKLARRLIAGSPADDRAQSVSTEEQTTTFYVPGSSEPFDVPAANKFVQAHSLRVGLA